MLKGGIPYCGVKKVSERPVITLSLNPWVVLIFISLAFYYRRKEITTLWLLKINWNFSYAKHFKFRKLYKTAKYKMVLWDEVICAKIFKNFLSQGVTVTVSVSAEILIGSRWIIICALWEVRCDLSWCVAKRRMIKTHYWWFILMCPKKTLCL